MQSSSLGPPTGVCGDGKGISGFLPSPGGILSDPWGPCLFLGAAPGEVLTRKAGRLGKVSGTIHPHTERDPEGLHLPLSLQKLTGTHPSEPQFPPSAWK